MSHLVCYTIRMTIKNDMTTTTTTSKVQFIPNYNQHDTGLGWLDVGGEIFAITNIHSFDDFGVEQDTITLEDGSEWITQDGGSTYWCE